MNGEHAIRLDHLRKEFAETVAVQDFSVDIAKGEFFSLLGPSGCGKTTTLRMIAGLEKPSAGNIFLESELVNDVPPYRRHVNTVFQDYALFPHMTVKKNIYFPLKMRKISRAEAEPRIQKVLSLVNMVGYEHRLPQQLSGGQRQRIALARSLVNEPAALLLDEPLGALDFKLRVAMQKVLKDIQRNVGITFIYVTHDQSEAMTMSDRIAVMKDGFVHQIGTPDEVYNKPETAFVASFIGDMNFLHGTVEAVREGCTEVTVEGQRFGCGLASKAMERGEKVIMCLRTERVEINPSHPVDNIISGIIQRIIYRGTDYEVTVQLKDCEIRALVSSVSWDKTLKPGDQVKAGWDSGYVKIFPACEEKDIIRYQDDAKGGEAYEEE